MRIWSGAIALICPKPDCILCLTLCLLDVLKQADFMNCVIAKAIAQEARREHIIPTTVETDIRNARDQTSANDYLFEHLRLQATVEDLRKLCSIMKDTEGYRIMNGFGKKLEAELDNVSN